MMPAIPLGAGRGRLCQSAALLRPLTRHALQFLAECLRDVAQLKMNFKHAVPAAEHVELFELLLVELLAVCLSMERSLHACCVVACETKPSFD